jgi:hypothetical protein
MGFLFKFTQALKYDHLLHLPFAHRAIGLGKGIGFMMPVNLSTTLRLKT